MKGSRARIGFVATNSITQGEQVAQLWPVLFGRCRLEIAFAHRTFAWGSDARGKAHVHVVILGLDRRKDARAEKRLFSYPDINGDPEESRHGALSPYLFDAGGLSDSHLVVQEENSPLNGMGRLIIGSKPIDGGRFIFDAVGRMAFLERSQRLRLGSVHSSGRGNFYREANDGFWHCTKRRLKYWRSCRALGNGSPLSAPTAKPARACRRRSSQRRRRYIT